MYVFLHKERSRKSEKWAPRALKGTLVGYDGHTIHRVHIKDQNKVIRVKDLRIFEDFANKPSTSLPNYEDKPTFEGFLLADGEDSEDSSPTGQKVTSSQLGQKVEDADNVKRPTKTKNPRVALFQLGRKVEHAKSANNPSVPSLAGSHDTGSTKNPLVPSLAGEAHDTESTKHTTAQLGRKIEDAETVKERTSHSGRIVKPTAKARDANVSSLSSRIQGNSPSSGKLPLIDPNPEVDELIIQLTQLLDNWDSCEGPSATPTPTNDDIDPIKILVTKIHSANAQDQDHYVCSTQLDVEEPESYARAMQCPNALLWAQAMEEKLDQLRKDETWVLVPKDEIQPGHRVLGGKWVYKVKRDVNGDIA